MTASYNCQCVEKDRLFAEYNRCVAVWSQAVRSLSDHAGTHTPDFLILLSQVDDARAATQRAKAACAKHTAEHGC
jgi:hypothetical protein